MTCYVNSNSSCCPISGVVNPDLSPALSSEGLEFTSCDNVTTDTELVAVSSEIQLVRATIGCTVTDAFGITK